MTFRTLTTAALIAATVAGAARAGVMQRMADGDVAGVMDRLEDAVREAGATVFARVDHGQGAADVGMDLGAAQLLIFGNPELGTPVMRLDPLAGLYLPLKMLVYADPDGQVWVAYEDPNDTFEELGITQDAGAIDRMEDALENLAAAVTMGL